MNEVQLKTELERAYRALRGFYNAQQNGEAPSAAMMGYHAPTVAAAMRFVTEGELDGTAFFIGKPIEVMQRALRGEPAEAAEA